MYSRYSDGTFGVWYGADRVETTVFETVHHWRRQLLDDAGFNKPGVQMERKVYKVRCDAALLDLRGSVGAYPGLVHPSDYTLTHQVGARMYREGHPGLVVTSARCEGECYAILNKTVLSNPRQVCFLTYITKENGVVVERTPGTTWMTIPQ